jgi:hypothetical protein
MSDFQLGVNYGGVVMGDLEVCMQKIVVMSPPCL